ncbi:MAG: heavy-metal-associated domain-containing protein [Thiomicrorhabdus sp.]|nr:heavy-metal-associated domain-containing protein [Thiomicrorhabdus sp.]
MDASEQLLLLEVENIKCGGCAQHIKNTLCSIDGVEMVAIEVELGLVKTTLKEGVDVAALQQKVQQKLLEKGYPVVGTVEGLKAVGVKAKSFVSCAIGQMSKN